MKRIFDVLISIVFLLVILPIFFIVGFLIKIKLGSPVLFKQKRPGYLGKPFVLYKFRSMTDEIDNAGNLLQDSQRFNSFSKYLRKSSLDELPELFNVIKGDMSLVGPRPLLMQYLKRYSVEQARRHEVKPGITGWAQVNGRNSISWEEKFKLDVWYVDNQNFWLDLKILCLTIVQVFKSEGISQEGCVTAKEFMGNQDHE